MAKKKKIQEVIETPIQEIIEENIPDIFEKKQEITLKTNVNFQGINYKKWDKLLVTDEELKGFMPSWY